MELNNTYTKNPTVGIHLFENIPPVGNQKFAIQLQKINQIPKITHIEDISVKTENRGEIPKKVFVKGFGNTTLFTAGLIMVSKQSDFSMRLDGPTSGDILNDAEQICERNPTIVKRFYISKDTLKKENDRQSWDQQNEDLDIVASNPDELFASDYSKKGNWLTIKNWRKQ